MTDLIVVIGAGLAGISAAKQLYKKGIPFLLLEAQERIGGKVQSVEREDKSFFELGPQFFNMDMKNINSWLHEVGVSTIKTDHASQAIEIDEKYRRNFAPVYNKLKQAYGIDLTKDISIKEFYERIFQSSEERKIIRSYFQEISNVNPENLSLEAYIVSEKKYHSNESDSAFQSAIPLSHLLGSIILPFKKQIQIGERVCEIKKEGSKYKISTIKNCYEAVGVIVAIPPTVAQKIKLCNDLNEYYEEALHSFQNGSMIKATWEYDKKFWSNRLKGVIYTSRSGVTVTDSSMINKKPRLTMFIGAEEAIKLSQYNKNVLKKEVTRILTSFFGEKANEYIDLELSIWVNDFYCGGGYSSKISIGKSTEAINKLKEPYGKIIFASTELAYAFPNFMEGAIIAGESAVMKIIKE